MKKYILFMLLTTMLLLPTATIKAQDNKYPNIISISNEKYNIRLLMFNSSDGTDIIYSGLPLKNYRIIPSRQYEGKTVSGNVIWENPEYIIVEGFQTVNIIFNCVENDEKVIIRANIYGIKNEKNESDKPKSQPDIVKLQKLTGGIRDLNKRFDGIIGCEISDIFSEDDFLFQNNNGNIIDGNILFENFDNTKLGIQEIKWIFIPNDSSYETVIGYREIKLIEPDIIDKPTVPSLTTTSILLENRLSYDINLVDKVQGSLYRWTSSNPEIATVNFKNGLVRAVSEGETIVTCEITLPDNSIQKLESLVIVGYDENAPILTENELELEVGEKFTIGVENLVKGSKVSWKSSDKSIVKISSVKGKITTINEGEAYVTCTITTPQNQVIVLKCDISVTK